MRNILFISLIILSEVAYSAFYISGDRIIQTGTETGDNLRTWIQMNPAQRGDVDGRHIRFRKSLDIQGTFTDERAIYHFPNTFGFYPRGNNTNTCVVNFTDVVIHYTGSQRGYGDNYRYTANWTRVKFIQGATSGRSDFFNNGNYVFNFQDVTLISYGAGDYLHFQTDRVLRDITIINAQGALSFEPGVMDAADVETIINLKLRGVTQFVGGQGIPATNCDGTVRIENLDWNVNDWRFNQRDSRFVFVNPIKPNTWTGYSGTCSNVKEYYTHDVTVLDGSRTPIQNSEVYLYNNKENTYEPGYSPISTDVNGNIPQQEILWINNQTSTNYDRGTWTIVVADYNYEYYTQSRVFDKKIDEDIIILEDKSITEPNEAVVGAYTTIDDAGQFYDRCKWWKIQDQTTIQLPTFSDELVKHTVNGLEILSGWDLTFDDAIAPEPMEVRVGTQEIVVNTKKLLPDSKFSKIVCDGIITIPDGYSLDFPYKDSRTDSYVRIIDLEPTDTILFTDPVTGNPRKFVGECGIAYQATAATLNIELKKQNGDLAMKQYDLSNTGFLNTLRMGVHDLLFETMFMPSDRQKLFSLADSIATEAEKDDKMLRELIDSLKTLTKEIQHHP